MLIDSAKLHVNSSQFGLIFCYSNLSNNSPNLTKSIKHFQFFGNNLANIGKRMEHFDQNTYIISQIWL